LYPVFVPTFRISTLIETAPEFGALNKEVRRLLAIQSDIRSALPAPLNPAVAVGSLNRGRLLLFAADNTTASKLRHLLPRLLQALQRRAPDITAIDLRVQVTAGTKSLRHKGKSMPSEAVAAFRALAAHLPPSSLQRASQRIAASSNSLSSDEQESFKGKEGQCDHHHQNANLQAAPRKS
jgi:hypothetical protein